MTPRVHRVGLVEGRDAHCRSRGRGRVLVAQFYGFHGNATSAETTLATRVTRLFVVLPWTGCLSRSHRHHVGDARIPSYTRLGICLVVRVATSHLVLTLRCGSTSLGQNDGPVAHPQHCMFQWMRSLCALQTTIAQTSYAWPSQRSWPTLANPTLANRVWPALFGDRVWPNRLWPALVF